MGKPAGNWNNSYGGNGGAYSDGQSNLLSSAGGIGGRYEYDGDYNPTASKDGDASAEPSPAGLFPFGTGGGGGMYCNGAAYIGGKGGNGAVIIELLLN